MRWGRGNNSLDPGMGGGRETPCRVVHIHVTYHIMRLHGGTVSWRAAWISWDKLLRRCLGPTRQTYPAGPRHPASAPGCNELLHQLRLYVAQHCCPSIRRVDYDGTTISCGKLPWHTPGRSRCGAISAVVLQHGRSNQAAGFASP